MNINKNKLNKKVLIQSPDTHIVPGDFLTKRLEFSYNSFTFCLRGGKE